jgi:hypothetical protein
VKRPSRQAQKILRWVRDAGPEGWKAVGIPDGLAVAELVERGLVEEHDVDRSIGYRATVVAVESKRGEEL